VGDPISVTYSRAGAEQAASGVLSERPRPVSLSREVEAIRNDLAAVKQLADEKRKQPTITEILEALRSIENDLPKAVAAFKEQYPDGEFDIDIRIRVVSDKNAKSPVQLGNVPGSLPGPSAPAEPAGTATPAATEAQP
jgi:hypothetical protein